MKATRARGKWRGPLAARPTLTPRDRRASGCGSRIQVDSECLEIHCFFFGQLWFVIQKRGLLIAGHVFFLHRGHFQVPFGMVVRGGRRQSTCHPALHMSQRSILCSSNGL